MTNNSSIKNCPHCGTTITSKASDYVGYYDFKCLNQNCQAITTIRAKTFGEAITIYNERAIDYTQTTDSEVKERTGIKQMVDDLNGKPNDYFTVFWLFMKSIVGLDWHYNIYNRKGFLLCPNYEEYHGEEFNNFIVDYFTLDNDSKTLKVFIKNRKVVQ